MHFSDSDSDNTELGALNPPLAYNYNRFYHTAEGRIDSSVNVVDFLLGQNVHVGSSVKLHLQGGLAYARIEQNVDQAYDVGLGYVPTGSATSRANEEYSSHNSKFDGVGPKLGVNADYTFNQSPFGLVGGISGALLMGRQEHNSQTKTATSGPATPNFVYQNNDYDTDVKAVTNLNANVGVRYSYESQVPLNVELGYHVNQFLDADYNDNDVTLSGAYLTLSASFL